MLVQTLLMDRDGAMGSCGRQRLGRSVWWPVFRCRSMAYFGCLPRLSRAYDGTCAEGQARATLPVAFMLAGGLRYRLPAPVVLLPGVSPRQRDSKSLFGFVSPSFTISFGLIALEPALDLLDRDPKHAPDRDVASIAEARALRAPSKPRPSWPSSARSTSMTSGDFSHRTLP